MVVEDEFAVAWRTHHAYLVDLAFRMLGDIGHAEDVVQEAFTRLARADTDEILDARGWLTVVTSRLCLDQIRSAHARHEYAQDTTVLAGATPLATRAPTDPADRITLDEDVRLALFVVLGRLSPAERVVFILHDVFGTPFDAIAETLGKPSGTCRQLARRARAKIESGPARTTEVPTEEHRLVTERFITACTNGDLAALLAVLHPRIWGVAEFGPRSPLGTQVNQGSDVVAANLVRYYGGRATLVSYPIGGAPTVLAYYGQRLFALITLTVRDDLVTKIHVDADPATVALLVEPPGGDPA
jgi:RNA polymerase sigma-70 factor (ECF subfamily)